MTLCWAPVSAEESRCRKCVAALKKIETAGGDASALKELALPPSSPDRISGRYRETPHSCIGGVTSTSPSRWVYDAQGIPLCRVCEACEPEKLSRYRPEILSGYNQSDVDEPIEPDLGYGEERW